MRKSFRIVASGALALCLSVPGLSTTAHAEPDGLTATEIQAAVASTFDLPSTSDEVTTTSDTDSAAVASIGETTVDVPKNPGDDIKVTTQGEQIGIELPGTDGAQDGTVTAPGIVAYPTTDGLTANAVQADEGGSTRLLTIIKNADAPEEFQYKLDLPEGSTIEKEENGSLTVTTPQGGYLIEVPWAHDANGKHVWTQYFTDGESTIDLVVNHHGEDLAYPVTADPWFSYSWTGNTVHFNRQETLRIGQGSIATIAWYIGGPAAAFAAGAGAQWLSDYGSRRGMCLSIWRSWYYPHLARPSLRWC